MDDPALPAKDPIEFGLLHKAAVIAWAVVVALGGLGIGWLIGASGVGVYGNLALLALGFVGGLIARRVTGGAVAWVGWMLVVAMFAAYFLSLVSWLRFDPNLKPETWAEALKSLRLINVATMVPGTVCTCFGAYTAFFRVAR